MVPIKTEHEVEVDFMKRTKFTPENRVYLEPITIEFLESKILLDLKRLTDKVFTSGDFRVEHDNYIFDSVARDIKEPLIQESPHKVLFEKALEQLASEAKYEIKN